MASHQTGIAIHIKAFLPTGKSLDEQFAALSLVKEAHASGDYAALLAAATVDAVKTEPKTRRVEDQPQAAQAEEAGNDEQDGPVYPDAPEPAEERHTTEWSDPEADAEDAAKAAGEPARRGRRAA